MWKRQIHNAGKTPVLKRMGTRGDTAQEVNRLPIMWVKGKRVCMQCSVTPHASAQIEKYVLQNWLLSRTKRAMEQRWFCLSLLSSKEPSF